MIVAMICLLLTTALLGTLLKMAVFSRQHAKVEAAALQADWLAESALDRAAAILAQDPAYQGETWTIPAEELSGGSAGEVVIAIEPGAGERGRHVKVVARYPVEGFHSVQRTRRLPVGPAAPAGDPQTEAPASAEKIERGSDGGSER